MSAVEPATANLDRYLEDAVGSGVTPGLVASVREGECVLYRAALGVAEREPESRPMRLDTPFDLASLTKPLATALLAVLLEDDLDLHEETLARSLLPELDTLHHRDISLRQLLTHTSGLPAWRPLFLRAEDAPGFLRRLREEPLEGRPGRQVIYSDPGYMAAGEMVARAAGAGLDELFQEVIAGPLELNMTFRPGPDLASRAAATEHGQDYERQLARQFAGDAARGYPGFRTGVIRGEVHDHHAWIAQGVLGSAGLFGDAAALGRLAWTLQGPGCLPLPAAGRDRLTQRREDAPGEPRSEGFALNLDGESSGGPSLEPSAYGHTGFTGTSVWIEPRRQRIYILLTNRIHPRVEETDMRSFRQGFHDLASRLDGGS